MLFFFLFKKFKAATVADVEKLCKRKSCGRLRDSAKRANRIF